MITSSRHKPRPRAAGFTLIELLVVIGIIVLLISILLPAVNRALRNATRARMAADLQTIGQALEAYKQQFGDYPRPGPGLTINGTKVAVDGAEMLCWALIAPGPASQDGYGDPANTNLNLSGPGFRIRGTQGQVYAPLLNVDRFAPGVFNTNTGVVQSPAGSPPSFDDTTSVIGDRYNHPILYFVKSTNIDITKGGTYVGNTALSTAANPPPATSMYNWADNSRYVGPNSNPNNQLTLKMMRFRLGDIGSGSGIGTPDGMISGSETPVSTDAYILWGAGPDGLYGTDDDVAVGASSGELPLTVPLPPSFAP